MCGRGGAARAEQMAGEEGGKEDGKPGIARALPDHLWLMSGMQTSPPIAVLTAAATPLALFHQ